MKRLLILAPILLLAACSTTVPVKRTFPDVPAELLAECPDLKLVPEGTTELSKTLSVVVENYGQYKECQVKVDLWTEWYNKQKKIFEEVK
jgi:hypothetical protein